MYIFCLYELFNNKFTLVQMGVLTSLTLCLGPHQNQWKLFGAHVKEGAKKIEYLIISGISKPFLCEKN